MKLLRDWKWKATLAVFVLFTALVIWLPGPQDEPPPVATPAPDVQASPAPAATTPPMKYYYRVKEGDTVASLARLFVIAEEDLRRANRIPDGGELVVGKNLRIPTE
jgi:hypothetical protein